MDLFGRDELQQLLIDRSGPGVSIYLPTHRFGRETQLDAARLRKLLHSAEQSLSTDGVAPKAVDELLAPARRRLDDLEFWSSQSDGLAVFLAADFARFFRVSRSFAERLEIGPAFAVRPLLPLLVSSGRFYVLALSIKQVRLLEGTREQVKRLELGPVPGSLTEALGQLEFSRDLQVHASGPAALGRRGVVHGHGGGDEEHFEADLFNYFRRVAEGLRERRLDPRAPRVLACVEEYGPLYRKASDDARLVPGGVAGNPETRSDEELRAKAWPLAESALLADVEPERARWEEFQGSGRAIGELGDLLPAASQGRVHALFFAEDLERWGTWDETSGLVEAHDQHRNGDDDLLERAAVETLRHGGAVYAIRAAEMPGGRLIAATLRY